MLAHDSKLSHSQARKLIMALIISPVVHIKIPKTATKATAKKGTDIIAKISCLACPQVVVVCKKSGCRVAQEMNAQKHKKDKHNPKMFGWSFIQRINFFIVRIIVR